MVLKFLQKNSEGKKQALEQFPKVKTFSRAQENIPAAARVAADHPVPAQAVPPLPVHSQTQSVSAGTGKIQVRPSARIPESIGLQDTLWTDSRYLIHFMDNDGTLLHTCEVAAGETPVYNGETPFKADDSDYHYTFIGWTPEIMPADKDFTYTALYAPSAVVKPSESISAAEETPVEIASPEIEDSSEPAEAPLPCGITGEDEETPSGKIDVSEEEPGPWDDSDEEDGLWTDDFSKVPDCSDEEASLPGEKSDTGVSASAETEWDFLSAYRSELTDDMLSESDSESAPSGYLLPVLKSVGKTALKAVWKPMASADGYDICFARCGTDFDGVYCSLSSDQSSVTFEGLDKKTIYKMKIKPFTLKAGMKTYLGKSYVLRSITGDVCGKYTNAAKIRTQKDRLSLSEGSKKTIKASLIGEQKGKKVLTRGKELRYLCDDPAVATVSKHGKIRALGIGSCCITLIAPNGIHRSLPLSVHQEVMDFSFKKKKYTVMLGRKINLLKKLRNAPDESVPLKWKSSDKSVAYVNDRGIVTGLKEGRSVVRVKSSGGTCASVKVRVDRDDELDLYPWESISIIKSRKK